MSTAQQTHPLPHTHTLSHAATSFLFAQPLKWLVKGVAVTGMVNKPIFLSTILKCPFSSLSLHWNYLRGALQTGWLARHSICQNKLHDCVCWCWCEDKITKHGRAQDPLIVRLSLQIQDNYACFCFHSFPSRWCWMCTVITWITSPMPWLSLKRRACPNQLFWNS